MRSIRLLAATTVILFGVGACGDGDGDTGINQDPVANFTAGPCTVGVACAFTDASSDPEGANTITTRSWDFNGDGTEDLGGNQTAPTFTYTTPGTFQAKLTVTDNSGNTDDAIVAVTVNGGTANVPPTASFTAPACTAGADCAFTSTSTDTDGQVTLHHWEFGDGAVADGIDVVHNYAAPGTYNVVLTVTDNGAATGTVTQAVTVTAPSAQDCIASGTIVTCTLTMTSRSTVAVTLTSTDCEIGGQRVAVGAIPRRQTLFFNVCSNPGGTRTITDAAGAPTVFEAGSQVQIEFVQGTVDPGDPTPVAPAARVEDTAPAWTISIDDGGNPGGVGEPDFTDVVLDVQATAAP